VTPFGKVVTVLAVIAGLVWGAARVRVWWEDRTLRRARRLGRGGGL
jgi:hypothetical protein